MKILKFGSVLLLTIFVIGCLPPKMYYWGNYSNSLYHTKKNPTEESVLKHQQALENIIEESKNTSLRVPPGVYAELGYIYFQQNKNQLAIQYFQYEKATYPEAALFMDRLENAAKLKDKPKAPEENKSPKPQDSMEKQANENK